MNSLAGAFSTRRSIRSSGLLWPSSACSYLSFTSCCGALFRESRRVDTVLIHLVGFAFLGGRWLHLREWCCGRTFVREEREFNRNHSVVSWIINQNFDSIIYFSLRFLRGKRGKWPGEMILFWFTESRNALKLKNNRLVFPLFSSSGNSSSKTFHVFP